MYKQALQYNRIIPKQTSASTRSSLSTSNRSSSPNSFNVSAVNENEVRSVHFVEDSFCCKIIILCCFLVYLTKYSVYILPLAFFDLHDR